MKIPANKTAIVLIEPQNDFLSPGGTMYAFIKEQLAERNVINNLVELLDGARGKVAKIFYCPFHEFKPGFPELKKGGPAYEGLRGLECGMKADWGTGAWLARPQNHPPVGSSRIRYRHRGKIHAGRFPVHGHRLFTSRQRD